MAKIIYFTAGDLPTTQEKAEIAALNALAVAPFEVVVRSAARSLAFGAGNEAADFKDGTPPSSYNGTPALDLTAPPATALPAGYALVADGQVISGVTGAGANTEATISVEDGQISGIACAAP